MDIFREFDVSSGAPEYVDGNTHSDEATPNEEERALFDAASKGDLITVQSLYASSNVDMLKKHNGMNPVHVACMKGRLEIVEFFLSDAVGRAKEILEAKTDGCGKTLLILSCCEGNLDIVKTLVAAFERINMNPLWKDAGDDECGNNALHHSAWSGQEEVVKYLVDKVGVSYEAKNREGRIAIDFAAAGDHLEVFEYLLSLASSPLHSVKTISGITPLHRCAMCKTGAMRVMSVILCRELVEVDATTSNGSTPLHLAVEHENEGAVFLLFYFGADINKKNDVGFSACHFAAMKGYESILHTLVFNGADCNAKSITGSTPVHSAAANGQSEIIEYLFHAHTSDEIDVKVSFDAVDENGATPMDDALSSGYKQLATRLEVIASNSMSDEAAQPHSVSEK